MKWLLCILMLVSLPGYAMKAAIKIELLPYEQSISQILAIKNTMPLSDKAKELSKHPETICFVANIDEYLPAHKTLKPIYGCIFSDRIAMNAALLRAGLLIHTKMGMASDNDLFGSKLMTAVGGHDFNGEELVKYKKQAIIPNETLSSHKLLKSIESEFDQKIIAPIIEKDKDNFIFFAIINSNKFKENLNHELLHAQYYNYPEIRPILLQVWEKAAKNDRQLIMTSLKEGGYDVDQQELLLREFYSYFLQYNAKEYLAGVKVLAPLSHLVEVYRPKIKEALTSAGIKIVSIN